MSRIITTLKFKDYEGNYEEKHKISCNAFDTSLCIDIRFLKDLIKSPYIFHCIKDQREITLTPSYEGKYGRYALLFPEACIVYCYLPKDNIKN